MTPLVSFTFDGDYQENDSILRPAFESRGLRATFGIQTYDVDRPGYQTWANVLAMQTAGHEIASHSINHPHINRETAENVTLEVAGSKTALEAQGCVVSHFIYPFGSFDERVIAACRAAGYTSASRVVTDFGTTPIWNTAPINTWKLTRQAFATGQSYATLTAAVDGAKAVGAWLIFYAHGVNFRDAAQNVTDLGNLLDYCIAQGVDVVTVAEAMQTYQNRVDIGFAGRNEWDDEDTPTYDYLGDHLLIGANDRVDVTSGVTLQELIDAGATEESGGAMADLPSGFAGTTLFGVASPNGPDGGAGIVCTYDVGGMKRQKYIASASVYGREQSA